MKIKSLMFGSTAIAILAGVATASPAMAFTHHPSTPQEQQQTEDLNAQQLAMACANPGAQADAACTSVASNQTNMSSNAQAATQNNTPLAALANPTQVLASASVEANDGQTIGAVQKVVTDNDGKPQSVDVTLTGGTSKIVAIDANELTFDQSHNVVAAQLSADQIKALPPAPQA